MDFHLGKFILVGVWRMGGKGPQTRPREQAGGCCISPSIRSWDLMDSCGRGNEEKDD